VFQNESGLFNRVPPGRRKRPASGPLVGEAWRAGQSGDDWEPLKLETVARKARGDTPLLETGELRDSIEHVVMREGKEVVGYVGTNDPIAKYHEFGTATIPARPFLSAAAMRQEDKIHAMIVRTVAATFDRGGPHYRELRKLFHILHMLYREGKKFAEDFLDEDEQ
jgi:HK97 gp10 family phage protein